MAKKLFVAGLAYSVTDEQLSELFAQTGTVESAKVIIDHDTGKSKGFGFVEMSSEKEASECIKQFNETPFEGRTLMVKEARPKGETPYGSNSNSGGGGYGRGNGNGRNDRGNGRNNNSRRDNNSGGNRDW